MDNIFLLDGSAVNNWKGTTQLESAVVDLACFQGLIEPAKKGLLELTRTASRFLSGEAEWVISQADGKHFSESFDGDVDVVLQGMIEGKDLGAFIKDSKCWARASLGNNVIAEGDGKNIRIRCNQENVDCFRDVDLSSMIVKYRDANGETQEFLSTTKDLKDVPVVEIVRSVVRKTDKPIHYINLSAVGSKSALVNQKSRLFTAAFRGAFYVHRWSEFKNQTLELMARKIRNDGVYSDQISDITVWVGDRSGEFGSARVVFVD